MKKKFIWLPAALLVYTLVVAWYGWRTNGGFTEQMFIVGLTEVAVIIVLFFLLRYLDRRRRS